MSVSALHHNKNGRSVTLAHTHGTFLRVLVTTGLGSRTRVPVTDGEELLRQVVVVMHVGPPGTPACLRYGRHLRLDDVLPVSWVTFVLRMLREPDAVVTLECSGEKISCQS